MILLSNFEKLLCRPLVLYTAVFILGIMCRGPSLPGNYDGPDAAVVVSAVFIFTGGSICLIRDAKRQPRAVRIRLLRYCVIWFLCPLIMFAGYARTVEVSTPGRLKISLTKNSDAYVRGIISDISIKSDGYVCTLTECAVRTEDDPDDTGSTAEQLLNAEKINIVLGSDTGVLCPDIGESVEVRGKLCPFEEPVNYGQFDSELYYRIRGIDAKLYVSGMAVYQGETGYEPESEATILVNGTGWTGSSAGFLYGIKRILFHIRVALINGISRVLPEKEAGVLTAMLTGERGLLDSELKNLYSDGGIAHILSISALHVTLLGMGFFRLLMFLIGRLKLSCVLTMILMLCYGLMTGFSVSTRRAVIMLTVTLTARMIGRAYDRLSACGLAALIILLVQPLYIYDAGFRLSFSAVIGINIMQWIVEVYEINNRIVRAFLPCIAVQLVTLPVIMTTYYEISLYAILVNPLILIFMAILLVSGALAGGIGAIAGGTAGGIGTVAATGSIRLVARIFAGPVYFILKMYEWLCELELKLPFSKIVTGAPHKAGIIVYYAVLTMVMLAVIRKKKRWPLFGLILCACVFFRIHAPFEAYFIDVGQGDSCFIRCEGTNILVDGGSSNVSDVGTYRLMPFLKYLGVSRIDAVIISHTDSDHMSGILKLAEKGYPMISQVIVGVNVPDDDKVVTALAEAGIPVVKMKAGEKLSCGGEGVPVIDGISSGSGAVSPESDKTEHTYKLAIYAIAPEEGISYKDKNSASLTVLVKYGELSVLMTGDSGFESENRYIKHLTERVSILKVAHHGSKYSTSAALLDAALPSVACISCSKTNRYGHPAPETVGRLKEVGSNVFVTAECGMIYLKYKKGNMVFMSGYKGSGR